MIKWKYNGIVLPATPRFVLEEFPYMYIHTVSGEGEDKYYLIASTAEWTARDTILTPDFDSGKWDYCIQSKTTTGVVLSATAEISDAWEFESDLVANSTDGHVICFLQDSGLKWTSHDVGFGGVANAGMLGTEPDRQYLVYASTMAGIADQVRRLTNTVDNISPDEMKAHLESINV